LFLNPANILVIGGNNFDFVDFEELSKVFVLANFVPTKQTLYNPTHRLEVQVAREVEIRVARDSQLNVRRHVVQASKWTSGPPTGLDSNANQQVGLVLDHSLTVVEPFKYLSS
jgi:hypothetical protein